MPEDTAINQLSGDSSPTMMILLMVILGMLVLAVVLEVMRRRAQKRKRIQAEWDTLAEITQEKELSTGDKQLLDSFIRKHSPDEPLRVATVRIDFDSCVEKEMNEVAAQNDTIAYEQLGLRLRDLRKRLGLDYIPLGQRINSTRELYIDQALWTASSDQPSPHWFKLQVAAIDEAYFSAATAPDEGEPPFRAGGTVKFRMWREDDARYMYTTTIARIETSPQLWLFKHTSDMKRVQARAHYRIRHDQTTNVDVLTSDADTNDDIGKRQVSTRLRGRITSVSGGGLAMVIDQPLPPQAVLRTHLELEGFDPILCYARVVATSPLSGGRNLARASFVSMLEDSRDKITRHVFRHQKQNPQPGDDEGGDEQE